MSLPLVSICCITYNHVNYIEKAIESFLMQKTTFPFEIIINDDASTDGTIEILKEYQKKYPDLIFTIYHNENEYANGIGGIIVRNIFPLIRGKYIAICEGDDYWIDPLKLQKQVDFLEANPDYNFSMGRVDRLIEKTGKIKKQQINLNKSAFFTLKDYLKGPFSQTSSFVFRNDRQQMIPEWFSEVHAVDQSLVVIKTGSKGKIKYHPELLSIYRVHDQSVTHTSYNIYENFLDSTLPFWKNNLNAEYNNLFFILRWKYRNLIKYENQKNTLYKVYFYVKLKCIDILIRFL